MVEIKTWLLRKIISFAAAVLPVAGWLYAQQPTAEPRPARLEDDRQYVALLEEDKALQTQQDSIARAMENLRIQLRTNPAERGRISEEILELENRIFEIRSAKSRVVDRINALEQEWVLAQLAGSDTLGETAWPEEPAADVLVASKEPKSRNLVYNGYFRENLPEADYAALIEAQRLEKQAEEFATRYRVRYDTLSMLARSYAEATAEEEAGAIYARFSALADSNRALADSLAAVWNYIFDNKSYAYGYLLDKLGCEEQLADQETRLSEAMLQLAELRDKTASDQVADYFLRKQVSVDFEVEVARLLGLDVACDSLMQAAARLKAVDFRVPKIEVAERFFMDYEELAFSKVPKYTAQHPIPECRIYERGTIYRILLGRFSTKRPVSLFKGAYPLSYRIDDEKKWNYYAGGFATLAEAEAAQRQLKEKGFIRPKIVVWTNGIYRNLAESTDADARAYRVEIMNAEALSDEVRTAIATVAGDAEISKVGQNLFVVGLFYDRAVADAVAETVRNTDDRLQINVAEMPQ